MTRSFEPLMPALGSGRATIVRTSKTSLDLVNQWAEVHYTVYHLPADGPCSTFEERHVNRFFSRPRRWLSCWGRRAWSPLGCVGSTASTINGQSMGTPGMSSVWP